MRGISRLSLAGILDRSAQQISKMSMRDGEGGWTVVNYRRGRKKSHVYAGPPDETSRSRNNSSLDLKHTYAYVTRTGRSMIRGDVQRRYREPGYKPQFFDSRTRSGPAKQSYKKTNMKYTNIKNSRKNTTETQLITDINTNKMTGRSLMIQTSK